MGFGVGANWKGNRNGRPPVGDALATRIRKLAGRDGKKFVNEVVRIALNAEDDRTRLTAIALLFERGYGKPPQDVNIGGQADKPVKIVHEYHDT
jgi:hypothetical protein